ncbi:MAG: bacterial Ig-like domain-containing protein, partial [Clostridiales bacterium]|nr:bacterial Ig-like domain-containing protein [Clostridiales bacterium]
MKTLKRLLSAVLAGAMTAASVSGLLVTPVWASAVTYGDFKVTTDDGTCAYEDNVLTLSGGGTYTIEMADGISSTNTDSIVVLSDNDVAGVSTLIQYNYNITISNINIETETTASNAPFYIDGSGTVKLILDGDNYLTSNKSYYAGLSKSYDSILEITSISGDGDTSNSLTAAGLYGAGIGGNRYCAGTNITINGGTITASSDDAAGIGGGARGDANNITINGGAVTATGGSYAAGIGGGNCGDANNIIINGGTVTATGGTLSAGIGGGHFSDADNIIINGGIITAKGGQSGGAGIGGGGGSSDTFGEGDADNILITGGYLKITKDSSSSSFIGAGSGVTGTVKITGGYFGSGSTNSNYVYSKSVSEPYVVVKNTDASTKSTYPYAVTYLSGLEVTTKPSKTAYIEGQSFDSTGMVVNAIYANGCTEEVTSYTCSPETLSADDTEVYIVYDGDYSSVYTTVTVSVSEKEVSSIAVTRQPTKTDYIVGQSFDPSGMIVTATFTDGTTAKIDNDLLSYVYSESDYDYFEYAGNTEYITVSYAGQKADTDTFTVEEKTAVSIAVTGIPSNLNFYTNETYTAIYSALMSTVYNNGSYDGQYYISNTLISRLEDDGLELTVTYNDGSTAVIANSAAGIRLDGYSSASSSQLLGSSSISTVQTSYVKYDDTYASVILITYDDVTTSIPITILENELTGISVTTQPNKTSYSEGDSFDPDGMVVMATYADGSEEEITDYSYSSINGTGSVLVYITYGSFYDTVTVNVDEAEVVTMTGITASSSPTKTTYVAGENFDRSGMVIEAVYSDGSTTEITDYSYSPTTLSESDTSVIVTYGNYYTTIPISVSAKEITKIEVTTAPSKTEYVQGEVFNASGMVVTATYSDNTTADLASSEYSYSSEALTTLGNIDFEISAANCTTTTPITVIEKEISSISVTQYPDKISYYDGQSFDSTGMIVQASYNDGSTAIISDYSISPTVLTSGDTKVTVSKDGFSDVVKITVSEKSLSKIAVTSQPSVISYIAGETFNSSGMTVTAYYNDDSSETITDYTITNPIMTAGTDTVCITYEGLYATVSVTVTEKTVTGIEVSEQPSK